MDLRRGGCFLGNTGSVDLFHILTIGHNDGVMNELRLQTP
jgi:hypothetical protein